MSRLRIYFAVLATLAVASLGWIGWEQHRETEQSIRQTCIEHAIAANNVVAEVVALPGGGTTNLDNQLIAKQGENLKPC